MLPERVWSLGASLKAVTPKMRLKGWVSKVRGEWETFLVGGERYEGFRKSKNSSVKRAQRTKGKSCDWV